MKEQQTNLPWQELLKIAEDLQPPLATFPGASCRERIVGNIYSQAELIAGKVVRKKNEKTVDWDRKIDDILTSRWLGFPIMLLMLGVVFWLTVEGANYPSQVLAKYLFRGQDKLTELFMWAGAPNWLHGVVVLGIYRTVAWVVSVMLPPMAIFFPCFTLFEDLGYLPRIAFNVDRFFKKAGTHGKQSLTMSMGFGCNAAGVVACRIIESPRERLIAILTNNFVPCNGRFPTLIALATIFFAGLFAASFQSFVAAAAILAIVVLGVGMTLIVSWFLSKTLLRGIPSSFTLELPPYRKPQLGRILFNSFIDRTIFVLGRAIRVAAPAGAITWILANTFIGSQSLLAHMAGFLQPFGHLLGMDGIILLAFILGLPANEIVFPIILMGYLATGTLTEYESLDSLRQILVQNGWTWVTGLNVMLLSLLHFPCGTTLWTIRKETGSIKWTLLAALIPTTIGISVAFAVAQLARIMGWI